MGLLSCCLEHQARLPLLCKIEKSLDILGNPLHAMTKAKYVVLWGLECQRTKGSQLGVSQRDDDVWLVNSDPVGRILNSLLLEKG